MYKVIFLRDLRRFLADMPEEEREQALTYYEDYFEDAGPDNEQKVIQELGSPIDVAKQIKSTNQENIAYGQGNDFQKDRVYPNVYEKSKQTQNESQGASNSGNYNNSGSYSQNSGNYYNNNFYSQNTGHNYNNGAYQNQKKSWTQDPAKIVLVIILAILAIPVGIPLLSAIFGLLIAAVAVIFSLIIALLPAGWKLFCSRRFCECPNYDWRRTYLNLHRNFYLLARNPFLQQVLSSANPGNRSIMPVHCKVDSFPF